MNNSLNNENNDMGDPMQNTIAAARLSGPFNGARGSSVMTTASKFGIKIIASLIAVVPATIVLGFIQAISLIAGEKFGIYPLYTIVGVNAVVFASLVAASFGFRIPILRAIPITWPPRLRISMPGWPAFTWLRTVREMWATRPTVRRQTSVNQAPMMLIIRRSRTAAKSRSVGV